MLWLFTFLIACLLVVRFAAVYEFDRLVGVGGFYPDRSSRHRHALLEREEDNRILRFAEPLRERICG